MNEVMEIITPGGSATLFRKYLVWPLVILAILLGPGTVGATPDLPDLVVDGMEMIRIPAGQMTIDGQSYPETRYYVVFTIRNKGTKIAPPTRVNIECQLWLATDICPQFPKTDIPQLWPRPDEISGAYKIWNTPAAHLRDNSMWGFWVTVDPDNLITESNKENNKQYYVAKSGLHIKAVHADQMKKIVQLPTASLETGVPTASGAVESKNIDKARLPGPIAAPSMSAGQPAMSPLVIQGLSISPLKPTAGVPFELAAQGLNAGLDPIQADHPLYLTCRVIQGGPSCPVPAGPIRLNAVIPGRGNQMVKLGSFTARPGLYEITISPQPGKREGAKSLTFSVEAEPMLQKAPAAAAVPSGPPAISGTPPGGANQTPSLPSSINRPLKR